MSKNKLAETKLDALPKFVENDEGVWTLHIHSDEGFRDLFGGGSREFANTMTSHCASISGRLECYADDKNHAMAIMAEIAPQDGIEALLSAQMSAVHIAMMRHARMKAGAENIAQLEIQERIFNKLARTFTAQVEALRKHRHGGEQKMTVEHVTVNDGGQAIVGNVSKGAKEK